MADSPASEDQKIVFMLSPDGQGDGVPVLTIAIPKAAWEYMADTKTNTVDLTKVGLPIKLMLFGCDDRAHALRIMEEWNAKAGTPTQYDDRDFGIEPTPKIPTKPGFYWAKWRIPADGTEDNGEGCGGTDAQWEVVEVWENSLDPTDDEYLMVHVGGVAKGQPVENFFWGSGPLPSPK